MKVKVLDALMRAGKTSYVINMMNGVELSKKFIYITIYNEEVERVKNSITNRKFQIPDEKLGQGSKFTHFKRLIAEGQNIVTTHELFSRADKELLELLEFEDYTLIIDEVMNVIELLQKSHRSDFDILQRAGMVDLNERNQVSWKGPLDIDSRYNDIKEYALSGNLFCVRNTALIWNFPTKIFGAFEEVYILTYMFDGQLQRYYYDLNGIEYDYFSIKDGELIPYSKQLENRKQIKELITIYEGSLNDIGAKTSLSKSWFERNMKLNPKKLQQLKNNLYNYFQNIIKAKADQILWTTFEDNRKKLKGKGYSSESCFAACNARATNKYKDRTVLAYCVNRYMNPIEEAFFQEHGVEVNQDLVALSEMLQWIFRSGIRDGLKVELYIPSKRMRDLLKRWLDGEL